MLWTPDGTEANAALQIGDDSYSDLAHAVLDHSAAFDSGVKCSGKKTTSKHHQRRDKEVKERNEQPLPLYVAMRYVQYAFPPFPPRSSALERRNGAIFNTLIMSCWALRCIAMRSSGLLGEVISSWHGDTKLPHKQGLNPISRQLIIAVGRLGCKHDDYIKLFHKQGLHQQQ